MLKILFSPSEGKRQGGQYPPTKDLLFHLDNRYEILQEYNRLVLSSDIDALHKMCGIKKEQDIQRYQIDILNALTCKAIRRYCGVAYEYLDIETLETQAEKYLEKNCVIFSNLYGPLLGGDLITDYKVKQGETIGSIAPDQYYKKAYSSELDIFLESDDILDLRAGYYDKFYKPSKAYTTLKFMKNGKVVSHWAKAYRGVVLRELALAEISSLDDFAKLEISGLHVREIKKLKLKTEIVFDIVK